MGEFDYASSLAARMLSDGLRDAASERGLSIRKIGKLLGYKQAVVLSHMANGRVPIPLDRSVDIAEIVGLSPRPFVIAVLQQRHEKIDWNLITGVCDDFVSALEALAGKSLSSLSPAHRSILREVVTDSDPTRRWLSLAELPVVEALRTEVPHMRTEGLPSRQQDAMVAALRRST